MKNIILGVTLVIVTAVCIVFLLQNGDHVRVNLFHLSTPEKPLWMFVLGAFFAGITLTVFFTFVMYLSLKSQIRKERKESQNLHKELHQLRNQPIDELPQDQNVEVATLVPEEE
ncbi:MAG: LapA family protein [Bdellovibrionales bacterium]|nr:LapA family protein [Bdellovibrionales bacterium]